MTSQNFVAGIRGYGEQELGAQSTFLETSGVTQPIPRSLGYGQAMEGSRPVANKILGEGNIRVNKMFQVFSLRKGGGKRREQQNLIWDCLLHLSNPKMKYSDF